MKQYIPSGEESDGIVLDIKMKWWQINHERKYTNISMKSIREIILISRETNYWLINHERDYMNIQMKDLREIFWIL